MNAPEAGKADKPRNLHRSFVATPATAAADRAWWVVDARTSRSAASPATSPRCSAASTSRPSPRTSTPATSSSSSTPSKVKLTGRKLEQKLYVRHSGEPGGFRSESYRHLLERKPELPDREGREGHAPEEHPRPRDAHQAQGLRRVPITRTRRRSRSRPRDQAEAREPMTQRHEPHVRHRQAQDRRRPRLALARLRHRSRSTSVPPTSTSCARPRAW